MNSTRGLREWLERLERLHPREIELGLERVGEVWRRLRPAQVPFVTVTVGGTNGKGSVVRLIESVLLAAGRHVGAYTSPHLLRYNERIRIGGAEVTDDTLCAAFERVESARGETSLTYFEFGTLAALDLFVRAGVDVALLEVGLGGRLDAVNLIEPDVAVVTSVDVDHTDWLGETREAIGREKAGIFRAGRPAVCGDPEPPASLPAHAHATGARLYRAGAHFRYRETGRDWSWNAGEIQLTGLPRPRLELQNAATALMALACLPERVVVNEEAVRQGLANTSLPGRFQIIEGEVPVILDVAHNPAAATRLAERLAATECDGRTLAVVAMLADKDGCGTLGALTDRVDAWFPAGLEGARGAPSSRLEDCLSTFGAEVSGSHPHVADALDAALADARPGDRVLVFGSFRTVAEAMERIL